MTLPLKMRKRHLGFPQDLEDGELPEALGKFDDGYDENYMGDAADRARLAGLSELERECELYERSVRREELFNKWGIKCIIMAKEKLPEVIQAAPVKPADKSVEPIKDRSSVRRLAPESQREAEKRRKAIDRLVARRNVKKKKDGVSPEEAGISAEQQEAQNGKRSKLKARDVYSDVSSMDSTDEDSAQQDSGTSEPDIPITCLIELSKALLTRSQLEDFLEKPIFDETVVGCFVRIAIGPAPVPTQLSAQLSAQLAAQLTPVYRLSLIVAVEQTELEYQVGGRRTKRVLQLQHGGQKRSFQMHLVSNQAVTASEFYFWLDACERDGQSLPTLRSMAKKAKDIDKASNYAFTEGDVELMVQTKRQAGQKPVSAAYRKVCLIMERDMAVDCNDLQKASQLEKEIKQIDQQSLSEHKRERRVQYMSTFVAVPDKAPVKRRVAKPRAKKIDWQQYMRRKIAVLNRLQSEQEKLPAGAAPEGQPIPSCPNPKLPAAEAKPEQVESKAKASLEPMDVDKLDLFELHNFEINLDLSKLSE
ncbi:hypothetical protein KR222_006640 [Zaprionus bogoriensis]|nr:hypothetical protein KR222_006640 [Zaprionus bogoriensis]